jgi:hypothetical protein
MLLLFLLKETTKVPLANEFVVSLDVLAHLGVALQGCDRSPGRRPAVPPVEAVDILTGLALRRNLDPKESLSIQ